MPLRKCTSKRRWWGIHWPGREGVTADLPTCKHCHSSHQISRADQDNFRLLISVKRPAALVARLRALAGD